MQRQAVQVVGGEQRGPVNDVHMGHFEGIERVEGMGAAQGGRKVMVAHQQHGGNACPRQPHDALAPLTNERWGGRAVFERVAREEHQIDLFFDGRLDNDIQRAQEIHHPHGQAGFGVVLAPVEHVDMGIGEVENAHQ